MVPIRIQLLQAKIAADSPSANWALNRNSGIRRTDREWMFHPRQSSNGPIMSKELESRIEQLEIDLAHANHTIDELNTVVIEQGKQINRLTRKLISMTDQVEELIDNVLPGHHVEKPPHY
jgi:SlyX protein